MTGKFPDRCFAFDQFGPLSIRPCHGTCWARRKKPVRLPATYHRTHGIRYFHGCYSLGEDQLWGRHPAAQGRRPHPGRAEVDPGRPARRCAHLRDLPATPTCWPPSAANAPASAANASNAGDGPNPMPRDQPQQKVHGQRASQRRNRFRHDPPSCPPAPNWIRTRRRYGSVCLHHASSTVKIILRTGASSWRRAASAALARPSGESNAARSSSIVSHSSSVIR